MKFEPTLAQQHLIMKEIKTVLEEIGALWTAFDERLKASIPEMDVDERERLFAGIVLGAGVRECVEAGLSDEDIIGKINEALTGAKALKAAGLLSTNQN